MILSKLIAPFYTGMLGKAPNHTNNGVLENKMAFYYAATSSRDRLPASPAGKQALVVISPSIAVHWHKCFPSSFDHAL